MRASAKYSDPLRADVPTRRKFSRLLVSIVLCAINPLALAEHEADHRYVVTGYVLNEDESPIPSTTVLINANGTGARGKTDNDGHYSLRLHLHDSDLGRELRIKTDHGEGTIRAFFDPNDRSSPRVHHVNIIGGRLIEGQVNGSGKVPSWVYYLFGLVILIVAASFLGKPIKRLKKRLRPTVKADPRNKPKSSKARSKPKKRKRR